MTSVQLRCDLDEWARAEVDAGRAPSVDQLVTDALVTWRAEVEHVRARLDEARVAIARGRVIDGDNFLAELDLWIAEDRAAALGM